MTLGLTLLFTLLGTCGRAQHAPLPPIIASDGRSQQMDDNTNAMGVYLLEPIFCLQYLEVWGVGT